MKIQNSKIKIKTFAFLLAILTFNFCLFTFSSNEARAEGISLRVSPSLLQIKAQTPSEIDNPLLIENMSDNSIKLQVELKSFKASDMNNGHVEFLSEKPNFDNNIIKVLDNNLNVNQLILGPRQKKTLKLQISLPSQSEVDKTNEDYYFSVLFTTIPDSISVDKTSQSNYSTINAGIATNVILSIQYNTQNGFIESPSTGTIEEFSVPKIESGPVPFSILIRNTGRHFISPTGIILIKNMFGQIVGKVDIPSANILSNSSRYLQDSEWKEKFLLGFYEADLSVKLSDHGPILTKNLKFFVFPFQLIVKLGIALFIILIIYSRVRKRLR